MRKLSLIIALIMMLASAKASVCLCFDDTAAMVASDGTELIGTGVFDSMVDFGNGYFAGETGGLYALLSETGEQLTEAKYGSIHPAWNVFIGKINGRMGLVDGRGKVLCLFSYDAIVPTNQDHFLAISSIGGMPQVYTLDTEGNAVATQLYAESFSGTYGNDMLAYVTEEGRFGFCDGSGKVLIEAQFDYAESQECGIAVVWENGKSGVIDDTGVEIVPVVFDRILVLDNGNIIAESKEQGVQIFSSVGKLIVSYKGEGMSAVSLGKAYAIYGPQTVNVFDLNGDELFEESAEVSIFLGLDNDLIISDGLWGEQCVWLAGTENRYQNIIPLSNENGRACYAYMTAETDNYDNEATGTRYVNVHRDSIRYGLLNADGEMITEDKWESIAYVGENRYLVREGSTWYMIDDAQNAYYSYADEE